MRKNLDYIISIACVFCLCHSINAINEIIADIKRVKDAQYVRRL